MNLNRAFLVTVYAADATLPGCGDSDLLHTCLEIADIAGDRTRGYELRDVVIAALVDTSTLVATFADAAGMTYGLWTAENGTTVAWWLTNAETRWMDLDDCNADEAVPFVALIEAHHTHTT